MGLADYVKIVMLIVFLIAVPSMLIKRNIIAKVLYVITFIMQIAITLWAIASGQIESFALWIFFGFLYLGTSALILYSDWHPFVRTRDHDTKNEI